MENIINNFFQGLGFGLGIISFLLGVALTAILGFGIVCFIESILEKRRCFKDE